MAKSSPIWYTFPCLLLSFLGKKKYKRWLCTWFRCFLSQCEISEAKTSLNYFSRNLVTHQTVIVRSVSVQNFPRSLCPTADGCSLLGKIGLNFENPCSFSLHLVQRGWAMWRRRWFFLLSLCSSQWLEVSSIFYVVKSLEDLSSWKSRLNLRARSTVVQTQMTSFQQIWTFQFKWKYVSAETGNVLSFFL